MSHIHVPDGIIALWLCILGYILVGIYFLVVYSRFKQAENPKKLAIVGVVAALMLLTMSVPVPFIIPYHVNLSSLAGILLGPLYAGLAIFSVNLILALVGHGGITVVGLNTIVLLIEAALAYLIYRNLLKLKSFSNLFLPEYGQPKGNIVKSREFSAVFIATFVALLVSTVLTVGVVYAGTRDLHNIVHAHCCHSHSVSVDSDVPHHAIYDDDEDFDDDDDFDEHDAENFDIKRFLTLILIAGGFGWTMESLATAFIVNYINKVKPELLSNGGIR